MHRARTAAVSEAASLAHTPIRWLHQCLHPSLTVDDSAQIVALFARTLRSVIALSMRAAGATMQARTVPLQVGLKTLHQVLEVIVDPTYVATPEEERQREQYDYLIVYIKDVFAALICAARMLPNTPERSETVFALGRSMLREAIEFLRLSGADQRKIDVHWKQMNQYAAGHIKAAFAGHLKWDALCFAFKTTFPYLQPYLTLMKVGEEWVSTSILTLLEVDGRQQVLLNVPVGSKEAPDFDYLPDNGLFTRSGWTTAILSHLARVGMPFQRWPLCSQAGNCVLNEVHYEEHGAGAAYVRNARVEFEGCLDDVEASSSEDYVELEERGGGGGAARSPDRLVISKVYAKMAAPLLPQDRWGFIVRLFSPAHRSRRLALLVEFCQNYAASANALFQREWGEFLGPTDIRALAQLVYCNSITRLFPPEPDILDALLAADSSGQLALIYILMPFKDYGVARSDITVHIPRDRTLTSFVARNRFLWVIQEVVKAAPLKGNWVHKFWTLLLDTEALPVLRNEERIKRRKKEMKEAMVFFIRHAINADIKRPLAAFLAWFFILLYEFRYDRHRREKHADFKTKCIRQALNASYRDNGRSVFTKAEKKLFKQRWNIFVNLVPKIAGVSAFFGLFVKYASTRFKRVSGCKSGKDRATEEDLFECFLFLVLFEPDEGRFIAKMRHYMIHHLVFLKTFPQMPGTMPNNKYADVLDPLLDAWPEARGRLQILNDILKEVRNEKAKLRNVFFSGYKPKAPPAAGVRRVVSAVRTR